MLFWGIRLMSMLTIMSATSSRKLFPLSQPSDRDSLTPILETLSQASCRPTLNPCKLKNLWSKPSKSLDLRTLRSNIALTTLRCPQSPLRCSLRSSGTAKLSVIIRAQAKIGIPQNLAPAEALEWGVTSGDRWLVYWKTISQVPA